MKTIVLTINIYENNEAEMNVSKISNDQMLTSTFSKRDIDIIIKDIEKEMKSKRGWGE